MKSIIWLKKQPNILNLPVYSKINAVYFFLIIYLWLTLHKYLNT